MSYLPSTEGLYRIKSTFKNEYYMQLKPDGSQVLMSPFDAKNDYQKWHVAPVKGKVNTFKITSFNDAYTLSWGAGGSLDISGRGYLMAKATSSTEWTLTITPAFYPRITTPEKPNMFIDSADTKTAHLMDNNEGRPFQFWAFEHASKSVGPIGAQRFQNRFFNLTAQEAAVQTEGKEYDIIIVGSGIGGGVLANDLYDTNFKLGEKGKRILLLEKGGLTFHTHCLNTARPAGLTKDRGQQNDTFFANFKEDFVFSHDTDDWKGGPMYNVGGRSAAWGLFAPRIHDRTLDNHFHEDVVRELHEQYYDKAERLMKLSLPQTKRIHQHVMDRLNMEGLQSEPQSGVQWQWGRIASEFRDERNFDFAEGAYSTIDKLLEIAMSKPKKEVDGELKEVEIDNFKMVIGAEVRSLIVNRTAKTPVVGGVNVRTFDGKNVPIKVKAGGNVILCAGSVDSAAILLRSGADFKPDRGRDWEAQIKHKGGLKITDHDILYYSRSFRFRNPDDRTKYGAMKLQTYVNLGDEETALANMSIDASSFLPRGEAPDEELPKFIMVFILQSKLMEGNTITIDPTTNEPVVTMARGEPATSSQNNRMRNLTASTMESLKSTLGIEFVGSDRPITSKDIRLSKLELGAVAHELGSLPMANPSTASCLDENLALDPSLCSGVYVCDLSIFPYSPEANPTLTLAALAIRLSRKLNERLHIHKTPIHDIHVVNHSGSKVEVWLSNAAAPGEAEKTRILLKPGDDKSWTRRFGVSESLFVYKLDRSKADESFLEEPSLILAQPGKVTPII